MADIKRDLGSPFDPTDPIELAEFEGFGTDVPNTRGLIAAAQTTPAPRRPALLDPTLATATRVRAANLFSEDFLAKLALVTGDDDFPTPDPVAPDAYFFRSGRARTVDIFPPGDVAAVDDVRVWSFEGFNGFPPENGEEPEETLGMWPAPTIRVREGAVVHNLMSNSHGVHTIHHHGIEPTPVNDGVGHLTMEVGGDDGALQDPGGAGGTYHYQWKAKEAGTYFYHCHRNTVLHFELGMYGLLIVDPPEPQNQGSAEFIQAPYPDFGPGYTLVGDAPTRYDVETFWVVDDIDVRWHGFGGHHLHRSAGIPDPGVDTDGNPLFMGINDGDNPRLHDFLRGKITGEGPEDFFVVTGVTIADGRNGTEHGVIDNPIDPAEDDPFDSARIKENDMLLALYNKVRPIVEPGQKLLIRAINASYCTTVWRFPTSVDGTVTAVDARTLGRSGFNQYSESFRLSDLPLVAGYRQFTLTTAQRWDILIDDIDPLDGVEVTEDVVSEVDGTRETRTFRNHDVVVEFRHWINDEGRLLQTAYLPIRVPVLQSV